MKQLAVALSILALLALCLCALVFVAIIPTLPERLAQIRMPAARPSQPYTNAFPRRLIFLLDTDSPTEIKQVNLIIQLDAIPTSARYIPEFSGGKKIAVVYEYDLNKNYLPPGVTGQFWWVLKDADGKETQTQKESFRVDDPKIQWKKIENSKIAIYWYSGEASFGKTVFDGAVSALAFLERDTGVTAERQVQIFLYGNRNDFLAALGPNVAGFEGGRTHPEYNVVLIEAGPRSVTFAKDATVHEMTHVIMHAKIRGALGEFSFPHWLDEGLAMYFETIPGALNVQFALPLSKAIKDDTLLSLRSISGRFPIDAIDLGYAESFSVVDFIYRRYGREKIQQLLQAVKVGGNIDDILNQVIGVDTDGLEDAWRKDIGAKPRTSTPATTHPTPFPTLSLSTDPTPTPSK